MTNQGNKGNEVLWCAQCSEFSASGPSTTREGACARHSVRDLLFHRQTLRVRGEAPLHMLQRGLEWFGEFIGAHIAACRLTKARRLSSDRLVVFCQLGDQFRGIAADALKNF